MVTYRGFVGPGQLPEGSMAISAIRSEYSVLNGIHESEADLQAEIEKHSDDFPTVCTDLAITGSLEKGWELSRSTIGLSDNKEMWMTVAHIAFKDE